MGDLRLGAVESRFAAIIWDNAPVTSARLVELARQELDWKKSTTYTVLKRLSQRGLFRNEGGVVTALLSREEFQARQSEEFIADSFGGSLPAFLASFAARKKLSEEEIRQLQELIDQSRG